MSEPRRRRPTLKDVAQAAGTSLKTASRVINREGTVSPELTLRVEEAIRALGYERDERARRLRAGTTRSDTIGLIQINLGHPFYASVAQGVESIATERGVVLFTASSNASTARQDEIVRTFISRRVDGMVIVPVGGDMAALEQETQRGTAVVFVDLMPHRLIGDVVRSDDRAAGRQAVEHLLARGHRRVAFLGGASLFSSIADRYGAYRDALTAADVPLDARLVRVDLFDPDIAAAEVKSMLQMEDPPTAMYAAYVFGAIGAMRALREMNLHNDVAIVSADDVETADLLSPGLTVTRQDPIEIGRRAAQLLFERLDGFAGEPRVVTLPGELIERGSGEIRR